MHHITDMIEDALRRIHAGEPEAAVWRLAEAAGLLAERIEDQYPSQVGYDKPTGRGFQVIKSKGGCSHVRLVRGE
jgi:hypothetical protein